MDLVDDSGQQGMMNLESDLMIQNLDNLMLEYETSLARSIAEESYKLEAKSNSQVRELAEQMGKIGAGPKEVIDLHKKVVLKFATGTRGRKREIAFMAEARYFLLQLMGELALYYRRQALKNNNACTDSDDGFAA